MKKIQGIIPPMITPLLDEATIDEAGAKRIADRMIDAGVAAIFILGTTGESQSISMRLRFDYVKLITGHVAGRVPVLVAVTETSMEDSLALARHAKDCGAAGVVAAAPYYFPANQKEQIDWYRSLADRCPLPVYLYVLTLELRAHHDILYDADAGHVRDQVGPTIAYERQRNARYGQKAEHHTQVFYDMRQQHTHDPKDQI